MPRLTPMRESALRAMLLGPLEFSPTGWRTVRPGDGVWNSFTIQWLGDAGLAMIYWDRGVRCAKIRSAGREAIAPSQWRAA